MADEPYGGFDLQKTNACVVCEKIQNGTTISFVTCKKEAGQPASFFIHLTDQVRFDSRFRQNQLCIPNRLLGARPYLFRLAIDKKTLSP